MTLSVFFLMENKNEETASNLHAEILHLYQEIDKLHLLVNSKRRQIEIIHEFIDRCLINTNKEIDSFITPKTDITMKFINEIVEERIYELLKVTVSQEKGMEDN